MPVTSQPHGLPSTPSSGSIELSHIRPDSVTGFMKGLEALEKTSFIQIQQNIAADIKRDCGSGNTYAIKNSQGETLFHALEEKNCCCRWFCGPQRNFTIAIFDTQGDPALYLERPGCRCDWFCCFDCCCCQNSVLVKDRNGCVLGSVRQRFHIFNLKADVMNDEGKVLHRLRGSCCPCRCCTQMSIDIQSVDGNKDTGYISKQWPGHQQWVNMDHELTHVQFPSYIPVQEKSVLLGAAFLVVSDILNQKVPGDFGT